MQSVNNQNFTCKVKKLGVWLIGAYGAVATTTIIGAKALAKGLVKPIGLITESNIPFIKSQITNFVDFNNLVFGGHEIRKSSYKESLKQLQQTGIYISPEILSQIEPELNQIELEIKQGFSLSEKRGKTPNFSLKEIVTRLIDDILSFKSRHTLERVIVVNLATTEPPIKEGKHIRSLKEFEVFLKQKSTNVKTLIQPSVLYAYAAFQAGCGYINFTPSTGASIPALEELANKLKLPHCGADGKTGETLVKSVLAPMFIYRNLKVLSWSGFNILGNLDGKTLANPRICKSKIATKSTVLSEILGYEPHSLVKIDYVPSLGDWKTAWDFIHFEGFLETKMSLQFIWQGCDSILAAALVLDLIRLVDLALRRSEFGPLGHLALFFKKPLGTKVTDLHQQWELLKEYFNHLNSQKSK